MLAGVPVLAANEGGPRETVLDGKTGWLRDVNKVDDWMAIMQSVITGTVQSEVLSRMGQEGKKRVREVFSKAKMASRFEMEIGDIMKANRPSVITPDLWLIGLIIVSSFVGLCYPLLVR
jgi:alpha-1,3/alpha-1,6-mannosyltransferase